MRVMRLLSFTRPRAAGVGYLAVGLDEFCDIGFADYLTAKCLELPDKVAYERVALALEPPAALDEAAIAVGEGKERQGLTAQFHLQAGTADDADEQRVVDDGLQIVVGVGLLHPLLVGSLQHLNIFFESFALCGEVGSKGIDKVAVALPEPVGLAEDGDFVETCGVESLPGQVE